MTQRFDLVDVVLKLSACQTTDDVVRVLRESTRSLINAEGITVVLRDVDKCYYVDEDAIGPLWKGLRFPMSACISGWCMIHKEQVVIADIYADARIPHDAYRPTFVRSLAMTPIRSSDPIGAIGAYWANEHTATTEELAVLQALGDSAAMAFENAQMIETLKEVSRRKDAFLSMLAHELRNPLAPIRNGLHLLRLQGGDPEVVLETAETMERQVSHMTRLVDDLLDVARINSGKVTLKRAKIDLVTLVRQCVEDHRQAIDGAGLKLKLELPLSRVHVNADPTRLTQVFGNLLDNARKYTPNGGTIAVTLSVNTDTNSATVEFADDGVGIARHLLPNIFESFTQADTSLERTGGGLGLGLAVASGLVKQHEGAIAANSDGIGKGARFTVVLPAVQVVEVSLPPIASTTTAGSEKLRLLIVEDNPDSARTLSRLLKACGYGTSVAFDGAQGVELAKVEKPDIILCDIGLPKMDGYAVASALRSSSETSNMRLIAVTGYGSDDDRERARSAGFDAHVVKPINLQELLKHIANLGASKVA